MFIRFLSSSLVQVMARMGFADVASSPCSDDGSFSALREEKRKKALEKRSTFYS